jgi:hypothetical protein
MYSRQIELLARQRTDELTSGNSYAQPRTTMRGSRRLIRIQAGWALVSIGLRLAGSSSH